MKPKDFKEAAHIMTHGFREKLVSLRSWPDEKVARLMILAKVFDESNLEGHYVATVDGQVAGIMHLDWYEQHRNRKDPKLDTLSIFREVGIFQVLVAGLAMVFMAENVAKDELYIDYIAVSPDYRGHGLGSTMMTFGQEMAIGMEQIRRYTLRVIGRNEGALRLYERFGFRITSTRRHRLLKYLTSIKVHHYMEKMI